MHPQKCVICPRLSCRLFYWVLLVALLAPCTLSFGPAYAQDAPLPTPTAEQLRQLSLRAHPRLIATTERFEELQDQVATPGTATVWYQEIKKEADSYLNDGNYPRYHIPDGKRLLAMSRRVLDRVRTLGLVYRIEEDPRYAERLWKELEAAAAFPDWNTSHFLDTAEMTQAFALGYDWLYDYWTPEQRELIRRTIVEMGLKPALSAYREGDWWTDVEHNWNQVCNGGIGIGALAIMDEEPALASSVLHEALVRLPRAMEHYAPDGAWNEGPGYWHYGTSYNTFILAALQTSYGTDFGLSSMPGFAETGTFPIYMTSPTGRAFNFADGSDRAARGPELLWMATRYNRPVYARYQQATESPDALDLLWLTQPALAEATTELPLDRYFEGTETISFRSAWNDPDAVFVGFKAGDNKANHSNLDLGTFVLDALSERWAVDLGADNYNLPGYFETTNRRWDYYRNRAEGQNTLVLQPDAKPDQNPKASAKIVRVEMEPDAAFAIADLTPAYARHANRVHRGIALIDKRSRVIVQDEIEAGTPVETWWFMHTTAGIEVAPDGKTAILSKSGKRLQAKLLSPSGARFTIMDAAPLPSSPNPDGQKNNEGIRKLTIRLEPAASQRITVLLTPLPNGATPPGVQPAIQPLAAW